MLSGIHFLDLIRPMWCWPRWQLGILGLAILICNIFILELIGGLIFIIDLLVDIFIARAEIKFQSHTVVTYGEIKLTNTVIAAAPVKVGICILRVNFNYSAEVFDGLLVSCKSLIRNTSIMESVDVSFVLMNDCRVVHNCFFIAAELG